MRRRPKGVDPNSMQQWRWRLITLGEKAGEHFGVALLSRNGNPKLGLPVVERGKGDAMTVIEDRVLVIRRITLPPEDRDRFYGLILNDIMPRMFDLPGMLRAEVFGSETEVLIMVLWESEDHRRAAFDIGDIDFRNSVGLPTCRSRLTFCSTVTMPPGRLHEASNSRIITTLYPERAPDLAQRAHFCPDRVPESP